MMRDWLSIILNVSPFCCIETSHDCSLVLDKTSFVYDPYMETTAVSALMSLYKKDLEGFNIFGIIKETGVDD